MQLVGIPSQLLIISARLVKYNDDKHTTNHLLTGRSRKVNSIFRFLLSIAVVPEVMFIFICCLLFTIPIHVMYNGLLVHVRSAVYFLCCLLFESGLHTLIRGVA